MASIYKSSLVDREDSNFRMLLDAVAEQYGVDAVTGRNDAVWGFTPIHGITMAQFRSQVEEFDEYLPFFPSNGKFHTLGEALGLEGVAHPLQGYIARIGDLEASEIDPKLDWDAKLREIRERRADSGKYEFEEATSDNLGTKMDL